MLRYKSEIRLLMQQSPLIVPMICASVKRLLRIRLLLQKVEQTLHQSEGSFGEQVTLKSKISGSVL